MGAEALKFSFDNDLTQKRVPTLGLTQSELDKQLAEAKQAGFNEAQALFEQNQQAQSAQHLASIEQHFIDQLKHLGDGLQDIRDEVEANGALITKKALEKLLPSLLAHKPLADIDTMIAKCFADALGAPHIVVRCHPNHVEAITPMAKNAGEKTGFEGTIITMGDDEMGVADCKLEWAQGGFIKDTKQIQAQIFAALDEFMIAQGGKLDALDTTQNDDPTPQDSEPVGHMENET